ncbi:MAG TPA: hypothetical protein PLI09_23750 [Candidatus Hydrogenedentes bacterium]|nr:hypothetical protein [Candidatus Hydrogenedentota bacterium]
MEYAHQEYLRWMMIEYMGVFWLVAEVIILFLAVTGRGFLVHLHSVSPSDWKPPIMKISFAGLLFFLIVLSMTYARHWFLTPVHTIRISSESDIALIKLIFRQRYHEHMIVWAVFVTGWVLLEAMIVFQGWRGYVLLRKMIHPGIPAK